MSAQRSDRAIAPSTPPVVLLIGRPNSGKSSLYNALTGGDAHVGNFPGITVDILEADVALPNGRVASIADLPGLYSIEAIVDPRTDEGVARTFIDRAIASGNDVVLVHVIDSTQLALGLRLTRELARRDARVLVVATQRDVLEREGRSIDAAALEAELHVPVIAVSARDREAARTQVLDAVTKCMAHPFDRQAREAAWDPQTLAKRVVTDRATSDPSARGRRELTARADALLLHPLLGPILFLGLLAIVFAAVFLVADPVTSVVDAVIGAARTRITHAIGQGFVASFLSDGLLGGAGTVLAFMPQIVILTVAMEILDATGYLARGAFLLDRILRILGLSGRSFLPLLMGHACAIPAIASTRIVRDPRERLTTILVLPLMTCSGRIPTYALLLGTFFSARSVWVRAMLFVGLYFAGIVSGLIASLVLRRTATKGRALPLVLEMPAYRAPQARVVLRKASQAATRFFRDVGTAILGASAVLWILLTVPFPGHRDPVQNTSTPIAAVASAREIPPPHATPIDRSIAAGIGRALEPITKPIGFDWRINVGLIGSFGARELMVGTMGVIFDIENAADDPAPLSQRIRDARAPNGSPAYSMRTALALLAFFVLACQCLSTLAAIRRETRSLRWPAFVLAYTYVIAYVAAFAVYHVAGWFGVA